MMRQTRRMAVDIRSGAQEAVNTYIVSLADLTVNSKPHINALTMLAEDYLNYAEAIVKAVDDHLQKVPSSVKLPILYLIDSIIKNVGKVYITLFSRTIVQSFSTVFEQVDEKTRQQMYKLRQTWNEIFPEEHLYAMDVKVSTLDPKWPITASPASQYVAAAPNSQQAPHKIHINPKFFKPSPVTTPVADVPPAAGGRVSPTLPSSINSSVPLKPTSTPHQVSAPPKDHPDDEAVLLEQLMQRKRNLLRMQQEKELFKKKKASSKPLEKISSDILITSTKEKTPDLPTVYPNSEEVLMVKEISTKSPEICGAETRVKEPALGVLQIPSNAPRIAPVSSALINLVANQRAQRDPRLSKVSKEEVVIVEDSSKSQGKVRDPRLTVKAEKRSRSSEKDSTSKISRHHSRESSADRSSSRHSSRREERDKRSSDSRKSNRKSEDRTVSKLKKTSSRSPSKSSSSRSPSKASSSRSPRKSASSRSPSKSSKSSGKHERRKDSSSSPRKSYSGHRPVSDFADSPESDVSDSKDSGGGTSGPNSSDWAVSFTKGSHKSRNYVRRNLPEKSPELVGSTGSIDVDFRLSAVQEKQIQLSNPTDRLLLSSSSTLSAGAPEQILPTIASQDVDLRCLPSSPGKKRRSAEPEDGHPPTKKNKAAHMEMLFGKQDVDLRQMDLGNGMASDAPSPPPPPIISSPERGAMLKDVNLGWSKFKQTHSPSPAVVRSPAFPRSSRHDRLGHSTGGSELGLREDTDMRNPMNGLETSKPDFEAILKQATEQYKNGTISHADYSQVQMKVFRMHETAKIREAQRNDHSRRDGWERRPKEKDYRHGLGSPDGEQFGDIDERFPAPGVVKKPLLPLPDVPPVALQDGRHPRHMGQRMPGPMQGQGYIRPPRSILGPGPRGPPRGSWRYSRGGAGFKDSTIALPPADQFILERIAHDPMKTITIDSSPREIRFYGENAVAMMSADDPREIAFDPGDASVIINDISISCSFNEQAKEVIINGKTYSVHLGAPTRELYINDEGFECQFNCPPKEVLLATGEVLAIQLQSNDAPKVHVGAQRRDLVAGRVMLIIDAETYIPIFLDAKPQRFDIDGVPHVIKFADALDTVLVNNHPFNIKFGGPAVPITVNNMRHYMRLTELPPDVVPGEVEIVSMSSHFRKTTRVATGAGAHAAAPWAGPGSAPSLAPTPHASNPARIPETDHEPALPVRGGLAVLNRGGMPKKIMKLKGRRDPTETLKPARIEERQMPADLYQALQPGPEAAAEVSASNSSTSTATFPSSDPEATTSSGSNGIPFIQTDLNIHKLLQSLYDTGLIAKKDSNAIKEEKDVKKIHEVDFKDSKSLKVNQPAIIDILYSGIQCSSCGTRFPPEQTEKYSAHLDWHFRQNRRDKDSQRKPQSRKWYYDVSDWIQFEEIDDTLDKAQNWFDTQQTETAKFEEVEEEEIQSVPSKDFPEGTICELCHDRFDQFYNEDKEEWHLKDCLVADGLPYHPFCYKDYRVSVESKDEEQTEPVEEAESKAEAVDNPSEETEKSKEPNDDVKKIKEEKSDDVEMEEQAREIKQELEKPSEDAECTNAVVKQEILDDEQSINPEEGLDAKPDEKGESSGEGNELKEEEQVEETEKQSQEGEEVEGDAEQKDSKDSNAETEAESGDAAGTAESAEEPKTLEEKLLHDPITDTTSAVVSCSIDGNLELAQAPPTLPAIPNRIKINISKPIVKPTEEAKDESDREEENGDAECQGSSQQDPSEEKPVVFKPKLLGRRLKELPPMLKGSETSGLCSLM
ncbi:pre-mRNA cleavage complex 2 protein Pcf11 isoform X2 [Frankliniella occidentalis]|uniref:Pre-mRNA cleavage complex 2 protein Pcf11 isoform X2 n=1 Tax=Frankliniella occidentalis TaxID=133901 RepID=A0A6J1SUV6_FRAOC|nr:pre-mRNA cleavage complex 2 protein Pcf11 isoform X2 [Frankliniella occidentalis]